MIAIRFNPASAEDGYEYAAALDKAHDYPREHESSDPLIDWTPGTPLPYTETLAEVLEDVSGGVIVLVDEAYSDPVDGQQVTITPRGGGTKQVTILRHGPGRSAFPIASIDREEMTRRPPRGGLPAPASLAARAKGRER